LEFSLQDTLKERVTPLIKQERRQRKDYENEKPERESLPNPSTV
jgi:hypothetical protein